MFLELPYRGTVQIDGLRDVNFVVALAPAGQYSSCPYSSRGRCHLYTSETRMFYPFFLVAGRACWRYRAIELLGSVEASARPPRFVLRLVTLQRRQLCRCTFFWQKADVGASAVSRSPRVVSEALPHSTGHRGLSQMHFARQAKIGRD
jgi:hypothetical protein